MIQRIYRILISVFIFYFYFCFSFDSKAVPKEWITLNDSVIHEFHVKEGIANDVLIVAGGKVQDDIPVENILARYQTGYKAGYY